MGADALLAWAKKACVATALPVSLAICVGVQIEMFATQTQEKQCI